MNVHKFFFTIKTRILLLIIQSIDVKKAWLDIFEDSFFHKKRLSYGSLFVN